MQPLEYLLLSLPVLVLSLTVHEFMHAWVALKQGDDTAYQQGRVTLNPVVHTDPIGTLLLPGIAALTGAPMIGWARPTPVTPRKFRNYRRGDLLVSAAGVAGNLLLAFAFALLCVATVWAGRALPGLDRTWELLLAMFAMGIQLNILLILFNLLPLPGLDGSHILRHFLPAQVAAQYRALEPYGIIILFGLLFLGGFRWLQPTVAAISGYFGVGISLLT